MRPLILLAALAASFSAGVCKAQQRFGDTEADQQLIREAVRESNAKAMKWLAAWNACRFGDGRQEFKLIERNTITETETYRCRDGSTFVTK
jgi:hypothetical protein